MSEDKLYGLTLSFHYTGLKDKTQAVSLVAGAPAHWAILSTQSFTLHMPFRNGKKCLMHMFKLWLFNDMIPLHGLGANMRKKSPLS